LSLFVLHKALIASRGIRNRIQGQMQILDARTSAVTDGF